MGIIPMYTKEFMNKESFIELVRVHLSCYNMALLITKNKFVRCDGVDVGGFFAADDGIVAAGKNKRFLGILAHEYCHFLQWKHEFPGFARFDKHFPAWNSWLNGKRNLNKKDLHIRFLAIRNLELDCERRTVELIRKYKLPVNIEKYIQDANAYMYFYAYIKKHRIWPNKKIPMTIKNKMPIRFLKKANDYNIMPEEFEHLMTKHCV